MTYNLANLVILAAFVWIAGFSLGRYSPVVDADKRTAGVVRHTSKPVVLTRSVYHPRTEVERALILAEIWNIKVEK